MNIDDKYKQYIDAPISYLEWEELQIEIERMDFVLEWV
jgi:hypothetical protein